MAKEVGGHGGMDFVMDSRLVYCLQNGLPLDMDVYDLAEWCCLAELGELSMDNGCAAVAFPDFTRGEWNVVKGYKHAYASPEEEAAAMEKARAFTAKLKEQGAKEWAERSATWSWTGTGRKRRFATAGTAAAWSRSHRLPA